MNLIQLIHRLPNEIVNIIRRMTYLKQNRFILEDVKNYYKTKYIASKLYYDAYKDNFDNNPEDDINWFANDIIIYMNLRQPTMFGYVKKYYDIMFRSILFNTISEIDSYAYYIQDISPKKEINFYWGLLKPHERNEMIKMFYSPEKIKNVMC